MNRGEPASVSVVATSIPIVRLMKGLIHNQFTINSQSIYNQSIDLYKLAWSCIEGWNAVQWFHSASSYATPPAIGRKTTPFFFKIAEQFEWQQPWKWLCFGWLQWNVYVKWFWIHTLFVQSPIFGIFGAIAYFSEWSLRAIGHPLLPLILLPDFLYTFDIWSRFSSYHPERIEIWSFPGIMQIGDLVQSWVKYTVPNPMV